MTCMLVFFNVKNGQLLGNFIGKFVEYDKKNMVTVWRNYMRVRVCFDVRNQLRRHKVVKKPDWGCFTASFKYERLTTFCFLCGIIGHTDIYCECMGNGSAEAQNV